MTLCPCHLRPGGRCRIRPVPKFLRFNHIGDSGQLACDSVEFGEHTENIGNWMGFVTYASKVTFLTKGKSMGKIGVFVFQAYFVTIMCAMPYFNWQYAKNEGFASWMALGQIVPTYQSMVWSYYALTADDSEEHYRNPFTATREVLLEIDRLGGLTSVPKPNLPSLIERIDYAVAEAEQVGDDYLNEWHPSFCEEWRNGYTASLRDLSSGIKSGNTWQQVAAVVKYNKFSDWARKANP